MDGAAAHVVYIFRPQGGIGSAYKSSGLSERLTPQRGVKRRVIDLADEVRKIVSSVVHESGVAQYTNSHIKLAR